MIPGSITYYDLGIYRDIPLEQFLSWFKTSVPTQAKNVKIGLDPQYSDDYYSSELTSCNLVLTWEEEVPNPKYCNQIKQYVKKLEKWQKQQ